VGLDASRSFGGVSDGTRTRDRLDHNQELYLLSYAHHDQPLSRRQVNLAVAGAGPASGNEDALDRERGITGRRGDAI
jgi:hypothetical protein